MPNLDETLKKLSKGFKTGGIQSGVEFKPLKRIPFSSPRLNYMTYGGIPVGRIVEFSGAENSGKTTLSLDIAGQAQKMFPDKKVLFVDIEATFDTYWADKMNVKSEDLLYYKPECQSAEDVFQAIVELVETGEISLVIIDSLAAMVSDQQNEKEIGERTYAGISGSLTTFSKKIVPLLAMHDCSLIGINQVREDMNSAWGGTVTPGGKAWKHACVVRLTFRKGPFIDEKGNELTRAVENPAGNKINIYLEKSKVFRSDRRTGFCQLNYITGIDYVSDAIDVAEKSGLINKGGAWYEVGAEYLGEPKKVQGKPKMKLWLQEDTELYEKILADINEYIIKD